MKRLEPDAIDRAVAALGRQRAIAEAHGAEVRAVATSAVREAENRHVFLRRARVEAGVEVEVISGFEEARLIHLGVLQAVPVFDRRVLVVDIGGGSTEIVLGERDEALVARSLKLGAIRLTDRFFPDDAIKSPGGRRVPPPHPGRPGADAAGDRPASTWPSAARGRRRAWPPWPSRPAGRIPSRASIRW